MLGARRVEHKVNIPLLPESLKHQTVVYNAAGDFGNVVPTEHGPLDQRFLVGSDLNDKDAKPNWLEQLDEFLCSDRINDNNPLIGIVFNLVQNSVRNAVRPSTTILCMKGTPADM